MLFNSLEFVIFFPLTTIIYFFLPHKWRWLHLLIASCVFYASFIPAYLLILAAIIVIDYAAGIFIENSVGRNRRFFLFLSLAANIGVLAMFKYYNFFIDNLNQLTDVLRINYALPLLSILLPIGLSFHTFQAMSYTIEVYRGKQKAERHLGIYALYVMFYPQLVAGPIERPQNLLPQFYAKHEFDAQRVSDGLKLMLWGMFKKIVIADRLAFYVDAVYNQPRMWDARALAMATAFFVYQIYCDFSGYSDIAIGAAQVMGFKLTTNFNRPLHSQTVAEFWQRWHISLTTWLRDYIFLPLSRKQKSVRIREFNLFLTFLVIGIWHGAAWTFVTFGAINGFYVLFSRWTARPRRAVADFVGLTRVPQLHRAVKILIVFGLACNAGVFFRARSVTDAIFILQTIALGLLDPIRALTLENTLISPAQLALCLAVIVFLEIVQVAQGRNSLPAAIAEKPMWVRWSFYYALIMAIFFLGRFETRQFIYFQF